MNDSDSKRIRIIHLVEDLKIGGLERVVSTLARGLDVRRFDCRVWCVARGGAIADQLEAEGISVEILGITNYHNPVAVLKLVKRLREAAPAIVHTHGYYAGTVGRVAAFLARVPVVIAHVHSTYWGYGRRHLWVERLLSHVTDRIICCSNAVSDFVVGREGVDGSKVEVVYNGVEQQSAGLPPGDVKRMLGIGEDRRIVITVASLVGHKGHRYLLDAAVEVTTRIPEAHFVIVGDGPLRSELERHASNSGIKDRVTFTGVRSDVRDLLEAADVFVLPSCDREGLGIALIEAMAAGKPVVATRLGGIPEVVEDGFTGLLVPPRDKASLAEGIAAMLTDSDAAAGMGSRGREAYVDRLTAAEMVVKTAKPYRWLLEAETGD
ncbi:MAG: glycosyltransferase [Kiritimatiellia bacterium]